MEMDDNKVEELEVGGSMMEIDETAAVDISMVEEAEEVKDVVPELVTQGNTRLDTDARWYVLHTFSGYEAVAEDNLKKVIEKYELQNRVFEIFIPTEDVVVEKRGKKTIVPTKSLPSYIFVKMIYGDDIWHTVTRTRGITGFVGPKGRPLPLTSREVIDMKLERRPNLNVKLEVKDSVQVIDGPLAGQSATITAVDAAAGKCTASVNMFGRPTSVELYLSQIKKI
jgi:transcriptional antiterminator NusG